MAIERMEKSAVNFKVVQGTTPVDKMRWEHHLAQIARWAIEEYLEKTHLNAVAADAVDKEVHNNTTIDTYGQKP